MSIKERYRSKHHRSECGKIKYRKNKISKLNADIDGFPAFTEEIHNAACAARIIKEANQEVTTVIGGPHACAMPVETLQEFDSFDIAVYGEGESTFYDVVLKKNLDHIEGIAFKEGNDIKLNVNRSLIPNLETLPFPAWHLYDLDNYKGGSLISGFGKKGRDLELPVESARGCPFNCIFLLSDMWQIHWIPNLPKRLQMK